MKKIIAMMLALVMCFALVACGGSDDSANDAGFTTAVEGKLYVATNVAFPPYEYYEGTEAVGIDMDIARAIGEKLGLEVVIEDMEFGAINESVKSGKSDVGFGGMTVTPERAEIIDFTISYATGVQVVIVKEDSTATSIYDLTNPIIGVQVNTTGDIYTTGEFEDEGLGTIDRYSKGADAVQALIAGKIDCVVIDNEPAKAFVAENEGLKILETEYTLEEYVASVSKDNPELYEAINGALEELIADGTVAEIVAKYIPA